MSVRGNTSHVNVHTYRNTQPRRLASRGRKLQRRKKAIWLIYRDTDYVLRQENSGVYDVKTARRMLIEQSMATLQARIAQLARFLDEGPKDKGRNRLRTVANRPASDEFLERLLEIVDRIERERLEAENNGRNDSDKTDQCR